MRKKVGQLLSRNSLKPKFFPLGEKGKKPRMIYFLLENDSDCFD